MELKDVFELAAIVGDFPIVEHTGPEIRGHPNQIGQIKQIRPDGVAVDLGAGYNKWFHTKPQGDKRTRDMTELKPFLENGYMPGNVMSVPLEGDCVHPYDALIVDENLVPPTLKCSKCGEVL